MNLGQLQASLGSEILPGQISSFRGPPAGHYVVREFFAYQLPLIDDLAVNGVETQQLLINNDSDFEWTAGVYHFVLAGASTNVGNAIIPNQSIQINDTGSGRNLFSSAVPIGSVFGNQLYPRVLPVTKVFSRNSSIAFTVTNFDAAVTTGDLYLTLLGWKLYYYPGAAPGEVLPAQIG